MTSIINCFQIEGEVKSFDRYGEGHINDTYLVTCENPSRQYILQSINTFVFNDIPKLMNNYAKVTAHIKGVLVAQGVDPLKYSLQLIMTKDEQTYVKENKSYFRMLHFVSRSITLQVATHERQMMLAGEAFGTFQRLLSDFDVNQLHETIKDFHHTPKRFDTLKDAIAKANEARLHKAQALVDYALSQAHDVAIIQNALEQGVIPLRVTHNDTKLNNILFDQDGNNVLCVIDLDTIMPGSLLFDFGDAIRFACNHAMEDDADLDHIGLNLSYFKAFTEGFLGALKANITQAELDLLVDGALLMTYEVGIRFLTDYLQNDIYFKTHRVDHNLDRAFSQLNFHRIMKSQAHEMRAIIDEF